MKQLRELLLIVLILAILTLLGSSNSLLPSLMRISKATQPLPTVQRTEEASAAIKQGPPKSQAIFGVLADANAVVSAQTGLEELPPIIKEVVTDNNNSCGLSVLEAVELTKQVGKSFNIPWRWFGPLILSESSFHQWIPSQDPNTCKVKTSYGSNGREIAYGLAQVYADVHPECDRSMLKSSPEYNLTCGAQILLSRTPMGTNGPNWDQGVAYYKAVEIGSYEFNLFKGYQNANGFKDLATEQWVSW